MRKAVLHENPCEIFSPDFPLPRLSFITHTANEPGLHNGPVLHDGWCEIGYICSGTGYYSIDHKQYTVSAGDLVLINNGAIHEVRNSTSKPMERWVCAFSELHLIGRKENEILPPTVSPIVFIGEKKGSLIHKLCHLLLDLCDSQTPGNSLIARHAVCTMISLVSEACGTASPVDDKSDTDPLATSVISFIDAHYNEELSLDTIAAETLLSKSHLCHLFKKTFGKSPIGYLLDRRIGESIRLLASTNYSISEIACLVGYSNLNHFSAAFKNRTGKSPGQYRKDLNINVSPSNSNVSGEHPH